MSSTMHTIVFLLFFISISSHPYPYNYQPGYYPNYGGGSGYYPRGTYYSNGRCFAGDSFVELANGERKSISSLKSGDRIRTIDQGNLISTEMILMLDKQDERDALFHTLKTQSGHQLSLTEYHLIPIKSSNEDFHYKFAKDIQNGDFLHILSNDDIQLSPVINITIEMKKGYYAPLTMTGTLLVNQILASSFAHVDNHHSVQFYLFPLRLYSKLSQWIDFTDSFLTTNSQGLPGIISILFRLTHYFRPEMFFF